MVKLTDIKIVKTNLVKNNKNVFNFVFPSKKDDGYNELEMTTLLNKYIKRLLKQKPHLKNYDGYISSLYNIGWRTGNPFKLGDKVELFNPSSRYTFLDGENVKRFILIVSAPKP